MKISERFQTGKIILSEFFATTESAEMIVEHLRRHVGLTSLSKWMTEQISQCHIVWISFKRKTESHDAVLIPMSTIYLYISMLARKHKHTRKHTHTSTHIDVCVRITLSLSYAFRRGQ